jgi:myosin heavy subunit
MYTAAINLSITDIVVLNGMAIVLGIVIHFVLSSRRKLQKMISESEAQISLKANSYPSFEETDMMRPAPVPSKKESFAADEDDFPLFKYKSKTPKTSTPVSDDSEPDMLYSLKNSIQQQQRSLDHLLGKADKWNDQGAYGASKEEVKVLERQLEDKEEELQKVKQQLSTSQKMVARINEVYKDFDALQDKIATLEKQAKSAHELALELDDMREAYSQAKKELNRKQERLKEAVEENQRLYQALNLTEDKLSEANLQRQQLIKKVQSLENLNTDFHQVSEANKKLQNELRRIGELESMLSMVSDERDILLKRRLS